MRTSSATTSMIARQELHSFDIVDKEVEFWASDTGI
jgi:hypothetical protein